MVTTKTKPTSARTELILTTIEGRGEMGTTTEMEVGTTMEVIEILGIPTEATVANIVETTAKTLVDSRAKRAPTEAVAGTAQAAGEVEVTVTTLRSTRLEAQWLRILRDVTPFLASGKVTTLFHSDSLTS